MSLVLDLNIIYHLSVECETTLMFKCLPECVVDIQVAARSLFVCPSLPRQKNLFRALKYVFTLKTDTDIGTETYLLSFHPRCSDEGRYQT